MLRSSAPEANAGRRGQTEPIVALLAVAIVALVISMYAGFITSPLSGGNEREVATAAVDPIWGELNDAGVYDAATSLDEISAAPGSTPGSDPSALPAGYYVYVNVSYYGQRGHTNVEAPGPGSTRRHAVFGPQGQRLPGTRADVEREGFPESATVASRPIPIQYGAGDVRAGRLYVVVWHA